MDTTPNDDRISQLPVCIVHHILSLSYSPAELLRMTVLSKYWFSLTASFPILDFNIFTFIRAFKICGRPTDIFNHNEYVRDKFFKYVEYTTSRFCQQNVTNAHTFKLFTCFYSPTELESDIINRCVRLILTKSVRVLEIIFDPVYEDNPHPMRYVRDIDLSVSSLTSLTLQQCELPSSFMVDGVTFKSLKHLHLHNVSIHEEVIKRLTTTCPFLEELSVEYCFGFERICIYGHQKLRKVRILFIPDKCTNLKLSSHSLRTFVLHDWEGNLEEIEINTPNLLSFDYDGHSHNSFPLERNSVPLNARMKCRSFDTLWFQKLRRFLVPKVGFNELKLDISAVNPIDFEELKMTKWRPFELEHVKLQLKSTKELSVYLAVVEAVLWCCRPQSLTLKSFSCNIGFFPFITFEEWAQIVKFTYEKLLEQENEGETNIQIVLSSSSKAKKQFSNLTSLLIALPCDRLTQTVTFLKEEVIQEAGVGASVDE